MMEEEVKRQAALEEDAALASSAELHSERLHGFGIQIQVSVTACLSAVWGAGQGAAYANTLQAVRLCR